MFTPPNTTVGVVGGGQLGRMLGEAASPLGIDLVVSDPTPSAPAARVAEQVVGAFDDEATVRELATRADVLTFEIELADPDVLERVGEETDTPVHPRPETLRTIQDKLVQKRRLQAAGVPVPEFRPVEDAADLRDAVDDLGAVMLKARRGGYDGRGNVPVESPDEAAAALDAVPGPAMAEELLSFDRELAVMGCLGDGERDTFPVTETIHEAEILRTTLSPPRTSDAVRERARSVALDVLEEMDGRGVYGIELFEVDGEILLNEIAPRPHNSGHWTIEGCHTSQFEQHLRAVSGLALGTTERRAPTALANVLGEGERRAASLDGLAGALDIDRLSAHWYGKQELYDLRKMGHLTLVAGDDSETDVAQHERQSDERLLETVRNAAEQLRFE
jgi:5-(carboxyamino)imidazole ribonucleotide synthase